MKKNRMMRIAAFLLVAALLSICVVSGTYAKYTSEITGTDSARVAKWDVQVNNVQAGSKDGGVAKTFEFDLFKTITDTKDGSTETDINPTDGSIIAPGTQGSFAINLKNASEVTAEYTVNFTETNNAGIPIQYSLDGNTWGDIDDIDVTAAVTLAINGTKSITVYWQWAFVGNDTTDTNLGLDGTATVTVAAVVTATQVD